MQTLPFQKLKLDNFLSSKEFFDRGLDILSHFYEQKLGKSFNIYEKWKICNDYSKSKKNIQGKN